MDHPRNRQSHPILESLEARWVPSGENWILDPKLVDLNRVLIHFQPDHEVRLDPDSYLPGVDVENTFSLTPGIYVTKIDTSLNYAKTLDSLLRLPGIQRIDQDLIYQPLARPNDPRYGEQWFHNNTGQSNGTAGADMRSELAWDIGTGTKSTIVAVVDSGIQYTHPDLAANMWRNTGEIPGDNLDNDRNGFVDDVYGIGYVDGVFTNNPDDDSVAQGGGHGSHVGGIIGAVGNNATGISGVNWNTRLMALKCFGPNSTGGLRTDIIRLLDYAVNNGAKVVNFSLGGGGGTNGDAFETAITNAGKKGVVVVAGAGNGGSDGVGDDNDVVGFYPASYGSTNLISVAATDRNDQLAGFSNYGRTSVDLAAPGVSILSTYPGSIYQLSDGTSMATPMVSGAISLLMDASPGQSVDFYVNKTLSSVDALPGLAGKMVTGGRLNIFKMMPTEQTIRFNAPSPVTYGTAPVSLSATGGRSGNPVTFTIVSGPGVIEGDKVRVTGAGSILIEANQAGNSIFLPASPVRQTLLVNQAPLTVKASDNQRLYGSPNPGFSFQFTGFVNGEGPSVLGNLGATTTAIIASPVGVYPITPSATNPNYSFTFQPGSLSVTPAPLQIAAPNPTKKYGEANPVFVGTFTGLVAGDTPQSLTGITFTTAATVASGVGDYLVTGQGTSGNYTITFIPGNLKITPAELRLIADPKTVSYGQDLPTFTSSLVGLVLGDSPSVVSNIQFGTPANATDKIGEYPIQVNGTLQSPNYQLILSPGVLTITQATLTIRAENKSKVYGAALPQLTFALSGLVKNDSPALVTGLGGSTTALISSPVGTYPIVPTGSVNSPNYKVVLIPGEMKVDPASLTLTADPKFKTYGAPLPTFTAKASGFVNGDSIASLSGLGGQTTATAGSSVGTYSITPTGTNPNYSIAYVPAVLTVTPAPLGVKALDKSRVYGAGEPLFQAEFTGLVNGDTPDSLKGILFSTTATPRSPVGTYRIIPSGKLENYSPTYSTGTLTVTPAPLVISANDQKKKYGEANPTPTATVVGLLPFDNASQVLTLSGSYPGEVNEKTGVGKYAIQPEGTLLSPNYFLQSKVSGTLEISPANLTVSANPLKKVYGDPLPGLTSRIVGLVNGDTEAVFSELKLTTTARDFSIVGVYPVEVAASLKSPNYILEVTDGSIEVTPAPLIIRATNKTKVYGAPMPTLDTQIIGLVNFDSPAAIQNLGVTTQARFYSPAGEYDLVPSGTNSNYQITLETGKLLINRAALTIAATPVTKVYGAPLPVLETVITGLVNGDTPKSINNLAALTQATGASAAGVYPIEVTGFHSNYEITLVPSQVTITPAPLVIRAENKTKIYGSANPPLTTLVTGLVNGDTVESIEGLAATTTATSGSGVGSYKIAVSGQSPNYQIQKVDGNLLVSPAQLSIIAENKTLVRGVDAFPTLTFRVENLVNGEAPSILSGLPLLSTTATAFSPFGAYPISIDASRVSAPNYTIAGIDGLLTVTAVSNPLIPLGVRPALVQLTGTGSGIGLYDSGKMITSINPFPGYRGPIQTAMADMNNDGVMDLIAATGPGIRNQVRIYSGRALELLRVIQPYDAAFQGGVSVSVGQLGGDAIPEILVGTGNGSAPHVKVFRMDGSTSASFFAYAPSFTRGVNLTTADFNQDGLGEIVSWPNAGGGPHVKVFDSTGRTRANFFAFAPSFTGGFSLTVGDVSGDSRPEIIVSSGPGIPSTIRVFDNLGIRQSEWNPFGTSQIPVRVVVANLDNSLKSTIVTALGTGGSGVVKNYNGQGGLVGSATVFAAPFRSGLSVAVATTSGGKKELLVGSLAGGPSEMKRLGTGKLALIDSIFAADPRFRGGIRLD